jgi:hypothetical protein
MWFETGQLTLEEVLVDAYHLLVFLVVVPVVQTLLLVGTEVQ